MYRKFFKRFIDITLSLIGIFVLSPLFLVMALVIKIDDGGPVLYKQRRIGLNKRHFTIYKLRTMKINTPEITTHLLENPEQYITRAGRFFRRNSLDELPQLFNILLSQMTIIGPRPALWSQYDLIEERDEYGANDIKPGLTGWAQINGRDKLEISAKAKLDGEYVEKMSFFFDCMCFFRTISYVLRREGIVEAAQTTTRKKTISMGKDV